MKNIFKAEDGTEFETAKACKDYESNTFLSKLTGLTVDQIEQAMAYQDKDLARMFEKVGRTCSMARVAAGDVGTRGRKKATAAQPEATDTETSDASETSETSEAHVTPIRKARKAA